MAVTNFSPLLGLALPTTGDLSGTWGITVNDSVTSLLDSAVAGTTTLSTDGDVTMSTTNGAANQARNAVLLCTGSRTGVKTITAPAQSKAYIVINATTGGYGVKVVGSGPTTGVTVNNGEKALIAWNGSDFVIVSSSIIDLTGEITGVLPVANGGTGVATLTGLAKGNGTSVFTAATAGTDYVAPGTATTFTAKQSFTGTSANLSSLLTNAAETVTIAATAATGTINYDVTTQSVLYYTTAASANWTLNVRGNSSTTLDSLMATGQSVTVVFLATTGATAYYQSGFNIDGSSVTPKWSGGVAPPSGNASSIESYVFTIVKTGSSAFTVLASRTQFK